MKLVSSLDSLLVSGSDRSFVIDTLVPTLVCACACVFVGVGACASACAFVCACVCVCMCLQSSLDHCDATAGRLYWLCSE